MYTTPRISTTYYVTPEWKMPKDKTEVDPDAEANALDDMIAWEFAGDETLHPFWAVLRLSPQELAKKVGAGERCEFNMDLEVKSFQVVVAGWLSENVKGLCTQVEVPMMVNSKALKAGTELILSIAPKKEACKRARSWRDTVVSRTRAKSKAAAAPPAKASAPSMYKDL